MSTYSVITGSSVAAYPDKLAGLFAIDGTLDFATINDGAGTVQNDIVQVLQIPANTFVLGVFYKSTVSANLADLDIGDGATADGYIDGLVMTSTAKQGCSVVGANPEAFSLGKFYSAADTIDVKQNTSATVITGTLKLRAICVDGNL